MTVIYKGNKAKIPFVSFYSCRMFLKNSIVKVNIPDKWAIKTYSMRLIHFILKPIPLFVHCKHTPWIISKIGANEKKTVPGKSFNSASLSYLTWHYTSKNDVDSINWEPPKFVHFGRLIPSLFSQRCSKMGEKRQMHAHFT